MQISFNWLKEYLDFDLSVDEFVKKITFAGIEVENVVDTSLFIKDVIVGEIVEKIPHPNADKLSLCSVFDGENEFSVVCGANNCRVGLKSVFAPVGTNLGKFKIKKAKIRGENSFGMLCSEKELGISKEHLGIMELPCDVKTGTKISDLGYGDIIVEVEVTPNRPDLLGMIGLARDIGAILNLPYKKPPKGEIRYSKKRVRDEFSLSNLTPESCNRFTLAKISDVTVGKSPEWLKNRLKSIGVNSVNNIVDVTNFALMECGQPLHAFDYDKISGRKIFVRFAKKGESFLALNGKTYSLDKNDMVVADEQKILSLAGVIGGQSSCIDENTKNILLETACFEYAPIHRSSHKYKIFTDSSYRFERGLSPEIVDTAAIRALELIQDLAGGKTSIGFLDSYPQKQKRDIVSLRLARVEKVLNIKIARKVIINYLEALDLELIQQKDDNLTFKIPYFRGDITREIDLIEEIIRLYGYNNVKSNLKVQSITNKRLFKTKRIVEDFLVSRGFYQALNTSFVPFDQVDLIDIEQNDGDRNFVEIINPLGQDYSCLRTTLLPQLLKNASYNLNHGRQNIRLFELNKVYYNKEDGFASEPWKVCMVASGTRENIFWDSPPKELNLFDMKGIVQNLFAKIDLANLYTFKKSTENFYRTDNCLDIYIKKNKVGSFGAMNQKVLDNFNIKRAVFAFNLDLSLILNLVNSQKIIFRKFSKLPSIKRDLSILLSQEHSAEIIIKEIKKSSKYVKNVILFDQYQGEGVQKDNRSLTFSIEFSKSGQTLTDDLTNLVFDKILKQLEKKFSATLR